MGGLAIVEYEYARRRYAWSKRLNWVATILALGVGAFALYWGFLTYLDWQWLSEHFGEGGSTHWTQGVIGGFLINAILFFVLGGLGVATFALGFLKVRKALDDDNQDAIKRWTFLTGIIGALPGVALSGLFEFFIWRAHASEKFTIFGLLGKAPEPAPEPPSAMVIAQQQAQEDEARRKDEYMALFGEKPAPARPAYQAPAYSDAYSQPAQAQDAYGQEAYAAPQEAYAAPQEAAAAPQEAYAQPEASAQPEAAPAEAAAPEAAAYHDQPSDAPICTCGRPMEWIAEYSRWYCYTDDRYEGEA